MSKFYGLPPSWSPGLAIPSNVMDEGLERHAFVTKMMPRGTYDNTKVGAAGYAIPQYVMEERTGRGTFTTQWLPRGYYGPAIPHYLNRHPVAPIVMGGNAPSAPATAASMGGPAIQKYGQRAAAVMLQHVAKLPASQHATVLNQIMTQIDPGLPARVKTATVKAVSSGVHPQKALQVGLASAMSAGILAELTKIGRTGATPKPTSLLGLGVYQELGALTLASGVGQQVTAQTALPTTLNVGPFPFPYATTKGFAVQFNSPAELARIPEAQKAFIRDMLVKGAGDNGPWHPWTPATAYMPTTGKPSPGSRELVPWLQALGLPANARIAGEMIWGADPHSEGLSANSVADHKLAPIVTFERPIKLTPAQVATLTAWAPSSAGLSAVLQAGQFESDWGIFLTSPGNRGQFYIWYDRIPQEGWWHSLGRYIQHLAAVIAEIPKDAAIAIKDVAVAIGDEACKLANTPGAAQGAAKANPAAGIGVVAVSQLCGGPPPLDCKKTPLDPRCPPPPGPSLLMPLLIGGAALVAISLLTQNKKAPAQ